jgi:hypothetical protein
MKRVPTPDQQYWVYGLYEYLLLFINLWFMTLSVAQTIGL